MFCANKDVLSTLVVVFFFFLFRFYHHEKLKDTALSLIKHFLCQELMSYVTESCLLQCSYNRLHLYASAAITSEESLHISCQIHP